MSLKPIRDRIVVSIIKADEKTESGLIYKPGIVDERNVKGTVMAVGSGYLTDSGSIVPLETIVGDTIWFNKQLATELKDRGETLYVLHEENILSICI